MRPVIESKGREHAPVYCGLGSRIGLPPEEDCFAALIKAYPTSFWLVDSSPRLQIFDASSALCREGWCDAERGGRFLYSDSNHLGTYGSQLVGEALVNTMRASDPS